MISRYPYHVILFYPAKCFNTSLPLAITKKITFSESNDLNQTGLGYGASANVGFLVNRVVIHILNSLLYF
jgi:hypothetical protein